MTEIRVSSVVTAYLQNPREKVWGILRGLNDAGIQIEGIPIDTFEDWLAEVSSGEEPTIGLSLMFVPLHRLEKLVLDQTIGHIPSFQHRFHQKVGPTLERYLGLGSSAQ